MKKAIVLSLALIMVISALALADGVGAFSAFKSGIGARALAMGGAFVAVADDSTAACWNPAGLSQVKDTRIGGMSTDLFGAGASHQFVNAVTEFSGFGIGLGYERAAVPGTQVDESGNAGDSFTWSESLFLGSVSVDIEGIGLVGANVKYYMADSGLGDSASGFGFDLGLLFNLGDMFTIGVSAFDLGNTQIGWSTGVTDVVTGVYKVGAAAKFLDGSLVLAGDLDFVGMEMGDAHVGLEYKLIPELALRGGVLLASNFSEYSFTVGAGLNIAGLNVDAAYLLNEDLGNTLILSAEFSLSSLFGGGEEQPAPASE
ncbi:MAG: hypothetical protein DRH24_17090 [Deltaproteobacteria bacterium]|nr:MAG: hypothetical protein DRH24_17090 [Deltaproteobacteria bacterium]